MTKIHVKSISAQTSLWELVTAQLRAENRRKSPYSPPSPSGAFFLTPAFYVTHNK